jgi:hypothetical protein
MHAVARSFFAGFSRQLVNLFQKDFAQSQQPFTLLDQAISNRFFAKLSLTVAIQSYTALYGMIHKLPAFPF